MAKTALLLALYRQMLAARQVDQVEEELTQRGEAFFMVSGAGHEGSVALQPYLLPADWLHCHYRDKALMLARGVTPLTFFRGLLCRRTSASAGRQMSAHLADPALHLLSIVGPVGGSALQAAGVAAAVRDQAERPLVLCALGDGTTQEGEVLEGIAEAVRWRLPVLFVVQDNQLAISTHTKGMTFYSTPAGDAKEFYGMPIHYLDGRDVVACHAAFGPIVDQIRATREPALVVMRCERLANHTNADDQRIYRSEDDIKAVRASGDPITLLAAHLRAAGISSAELEALESAVKAEVRAAAETALDEPDPDACRTAKKPFSTKYLARGEYRGDDAAATRLTMIEAMRGVLRLHLERDPRVMLYGEDLEDPKGDVFGLTKGLTAIRPGGVRNSPLTESTIVGASVGRALAGQRPVAFIQFADFLPLAYNQIISELGSMYWRTDGAYECPVVVMLTCGGYRPGLGPFHAQTLESVAAHTPGVDVVMPSTAGDAAGLLNAVFMGGRPTLFFYPKNCLNDRGETTSDDLADHFVPLGKARLVQDGADLTFVAWGNAVVLCKKAAAALATAGRSAAVIDLRSLAPWDEELVLQHAEKTGRLVVVHEDNRTCGFGAEVLATVAERATRPVLARRVTRPDTYVPCNFSNQLELLPSFKSVLETAAALLDLDLHWELPPDEAVGTFLVEAIGSSPSDESVTVTSWAIKEGDTITVGQALAELEADKATVDLTAPAAGIVAEVLVPVGQQVPVGTPLLKLRTAASGPRRRKPVTQERPGTPHLKPRAAALPAAPAQLAPLAAASSLAAPTGVRHTLPVGLSAVYTKLGSKIVTNAELAASLGAENDEAIFSRTGIHQRRHVTPAEDALTLAVDATRALLAGEQLTYADVDLFICATTTPTQVTPSMACRIADRLGTGGHAALPPAAYDINAACSGYLYGLQIAYDFLQSRPGARVLLVTTEVLSPLLDPKDFGTAIIFGDAASATLLYGEQNIARSRALLHRPVLAADPEDGSILSVPLPRPGHYICMDGQKTFSVAVRSMTRILEAACNASTLAAKDLSLVVPHQANQRILDAVARRLKVSTSQIYTNIHSYGNTSSTSIPLCLATLFHERPAGEYLGLCAFGGGFTSGAAILQMR